MAKLTVNSIALRFLQPLFMQLGVCVLKSPVKVMEHPATVNKLKKIEWGNYFVCLRFI